MKQKLVISAVIIVLVGVCIALNCSIVDPSDYTGLWYRAGDGALYIFEDGIIECANKETIILDNAVFSGAYTYAKDKAAIFVVDEHGVGEVVELHLLHKADGDMLCERKNGIETVWFTRNNHED